MQHGESYVSDSIGYLEGTRCKSFLCTDLDVEEAYPPTLELVDSDKEGDSDIEID